MPNDLRIDGAEDVIPVTKICDLHHGQGYPYMIINKFVSIIGVTCSSPMAAAGFRTEGKFKTEISGDHKQAPRDAAKVGV
jgi:hypothetical protein